MFCYLREHLPTLHIQGDHSAIVQNLPLTSKQKFHFGLTCPDQAKTELVLKSTGGFAQAEWSPCTSWIWQLGGGQNCTPQERGLSNHVVQHRGSAEIIFFYLEVLGIWSYFQKLGILNH